jgi:glycerophosphoryl diester phosphodiesterase
VALQAPRHRRAHRPAAPGGRDRRQLRVACAPAGARLRTLQHVGLGVSIRRASRFAWGVGFWDPRARARGLALARRLGLRTAVYTVNDERRLRELLALGVDGIFTDRPELLLGLVRG